MKIIRNLLVLFGFFIVALALTGTQSIAANAPPFVGINYGPYHYAGQSPDLGTHIPDSQFLADLDRISQKFKYIRTYAVDKTSGLAELVPLIASNINNNHPNFKDLRVYIGVYESSTYRQETQA